MRAQIYILMEAYIISFFGLKDGLHGFKYKIENKFFEAFNYSEFLDTNILVNVELIKKNTLLEFNFSAKGFVKVNCDVSNEVFDLEIDGKMAMVVKFGNEFNDDNDEILVLPHGEHQVNVAQYIYEMIVLAIPSKKVHPGIEDGSLETPILKKLRELEPSENRKLNEIDPRWEDLKKLLTNKNI